MSWARSANASACATSARPWRSTPKFVLAWDALRHVSCKSLPAGSMARRPTDVAEVEQIRSRIAQLAPDHWSVKHEHAYSLWHEGKRAEAIAVAKEIRTAGRRPSNTPIHTPT